MPTVEDARKWAYEKDFDGSGPYEPPIGITVLADVDGQLWATYHGCSVTPHMFIIDQGGVMIDNACRGTLMQCLMGGVPCGSQKERARGVLNNILPAKWCGTSSP